MSIITCSCCGKRKLSKNIIYDIDDNPICVDCIREFYTSCASCGRYFRINGKTVCRECESVVYLNTINSYNTKPYPVFKNYNSDIETEIKGKRYYGIEMEFNNVSPKEIQKKSIDLYRKKYLYNKRDGSIPSGVEVVTSPLDRKSIVYILDGFKYSLEYISKRDYKNNAGVHIHVNKKSISPITRYKIYMLLNNQATHKEINIMYYLSGRYSDIGFIPDGCVGAPDRYYKLGESKYKSYKKDNDRYQALNVKNKTTFEFRLFKASSSKEEILSYVDMVDSIIDFCDVNGIKDMRVSNFILYLKSKSKNKILLDKIKLFEDKFGAFEKSTTIVDKTKMINLISKFKWYEYYKILTRISIPTKITQTNIDELCGEIKLILENKSSIKMSYYTFCVNTNNRFGLAYDLNKELKSKIIEKFFK